MSIKLLFRPRFLLFSGPVVKTEIDLLLPTGPKLQRQSTKKEFSLLSTSLFLWPLRCCVVSSRYISRRKHHGNLFKVLLLKQPNLPSRKKTGLFLLLFKIKRQATSVDPFGESRRLLRIIVSAGGFFPLFFSSWGETKSFHDDDASM